VLEPAAEHAPDLVGTLRQVLVAAVRHEAQVLAETERDAQRVQPAAGLAQGLRFVRAPVRDGQRNQHLQCVVEDHPPEKAALGAGEPVHVRVEPGAEIVGLLHHRDQIGTSWSHRFTSPQRSLGSEPRASASEPLVPLAHARGSDHNG